MERVCQGAKLTFAFAIYNREAARNGYYTADQYGSRIGAESIIETLFRQWENKLISPLTAAFSACLYPDRRFPSPLCNRRDIRSRRGRHTKHARCRLVVPRALQLFTPRGACRFFSTVSRTREFLGQISRRSYSSEEI
jgi:hypothetical protein